MDKRVLALIIIFAIIALTLILCATVFLLRDIEVGYAVKGEEAIVSSEEIISASGLKLNKNVLFISEKQIVSNIQTKYPQVKVINVERVFPNKVIIYVTVRVPVVAVSVGDSFALLDREMFVTDILSQQELEDRQSEYGYEFIKVNFSIPSEKAVKGRQIPSDVSAELCVVQNVIAGYENLGLLNQNLRSFVEKIDVIANDGTYSEGEYMAKIKTVTGVELRLPSVNLGKYINSSYEWYNGIISSSDSEELKKLNGGYVIYTGTSANNFGYVWFE
ncbi:MAG: FtsQ-type POTRA domain-containing protein [Christensenellales bacterium]